MKKTITIIGSAGIPTRYGGFETLAENLSIGLIENYSVIVACSTQYYSPNEIHQTDYNGIKRLFLPIRPNGFTSILYDLVSIFRTIKHTDYLLILGGSSAFIIPLLRLFWRKVKIIYHPDGLEWERAKWNIFARLFLKFSNSLGVISAKKIIIDNEGLLSLYKKYLDKISLISYGGDHYHIDYSRKRKDFWLTIARSEPENNLITIAQFFSEHESEKWILVSNCQHSEFGKNLYKTFGNKTNIRIINSEYHKEKISELLSECKGYIHGHSSGGTNPSLVAAMWSKIPIICHDNVYNRSTTRNFAAYFSNISDLEKIIHINPENSFKNYNILYSTAEKEYTWRKIVNYYDELLKSL